MQLSCYLVLEIAYCNIFYSVDGDGAEFIYAVVGYQYDLINLRLGTTLLKKQFFFYFRWSIRFSIRQRVPYCRFVKLLYYHFVVFVPKHNGRGWPSPLLALGTVGNRIRIIQINLISKTNNFVTAYTGAPGCCRVCLYKYTYMCVCVRLNPIRKQYVCLLVTHT